MALMLRKLFYKKPPDGLLEISERLYVFDCCFATDAWEQKDYKSYMGNTIVQLKNHYPEASILIFNFGENDTSQISSALSDYDLTIMDYPRQYEGCPLLPMEVIHPFLRSSESWLSLGQQSILLMHCERGGWPVLAYMLAALLIYRKYYTGEYNTLDMIYKQAPSELLHFFSPLNPLPSQLRYLQYVSRRNLDAEWPPLDRALTLDCVIIRMIPDFDGNGGCCPIFRIYGQDPFLPNNKTPKLLYSTPKKSKNVRHYKQEECELVKIDIKCHVQGDIVVECISLHDDLASEKMMFRTMFNTAFIWSNMLMLNRDEIDLLWDAKDLFPKDFRAELLFSDMDAAASKVTEDLAGFEVEDLVIPGGEKVVGQKEVADGYTVKPISPHPSPPRRPLLKDSKETMVEPSTSTGRKTPPLRERRGTVLEPRAIGGSPPTGHVTEPHPSPRLPPSKISSGPPPPPPPKTGVVPPPPPPKTSAPFPPPPLLKGGILPKTGSSKTLQSIKLKPFHWLKVTRVSKGSLWDETQKSGEAANMPKIDRSEIESLFSASNPTAEKDTKSANKPETIRLIDHRRAYNCEIMLSKVKIPFNELMDYVLALEDSALIDADQVDSLIKNCPTKEEMATLKAYKEDKDKLGKCEQFFLELMKVPRTKSKLGVFSFKLQFTKQVSDLRKSLNIINSLVEQIRSSGKLKRVMQTILSLGNAMNQGTARGSAVGFRLNTLLKLTDTRAKNNRMTLMHYLCKVLADKQPEVLDFSKDLESLEIAAKMQPEYLAQELKAINEGLEKVVEELSMSENDGPVSENFRKVLEEFHCSAAGEASSLMFLYSAVGKNIDALIVYFSEDPTRCVYEQVVSTLLSFVRMFNQANEENAKQLEAEKKKAVQEALKEKKKTNESLI